MVMTPDLGRAYLHAEGCADVEASIHADDDMLRYLRELGRPADRSRFEYFRTGREALLSVENVLGRTGRGWPTITRALDFACGYGRLTRFLVRRLPQGRVVASDILGGAVAFVRDTLGCDTFASAVRPRDVALPREFDVITVLSLFSHLPRSAFTAWLTALYDALTPDGLLIFSTHGMSRCGAREQDASGFAFVPRSESRILDPDDYGSTYVSPAALQRIAASCSIDHLYSLEDEIGGVQDLHVAAKRPCPGLDGWTRTSFIRGGIDDLWTRDGQVQLIGWAAEVGGPAPLTRVQVSLDGVVVGDGDLGHEVPHVVDVFGRDDWLRAGWHLTGESPVLAAGPHVLAACGRNRAGQRLCFDVRRLDAGDDFTLA